MHSALKDDLVAIPKVHYIVKPVLTDWIFLGKGFAVTACHQRQPVLRDCSTVKPVLRPLPWETNCLEGPPALCRKSYIFSVNEPVTKDHLSWETTFLWPMRWYFKTVSTIEVAGSKSIENYRFLSGLYVHIICSCVLFIVDILDICKQCTAESALYILGIW